MRVNNQESKLSRLLLLIFGMAGCLAPIGPRAFAQEAETGPLREVIVSYASGSGKMQLFRVFEDGSSRRELTDGQWDCLMPAWSPDGQHVIYVRQGQGQMNLWMCDAQGTGHQQLTKSGRNLVPSWVPDSKHIVWMVAKSSTEKQDPASDGQLWIMNTETGESRKLFGDAEQSEFSNAMPVVSPRGNEVAFISNRSGHFRLWVSKLDGSQARLVSPVAADVDENLQLSIEQKVPAWSPDGKWLAHWEGVEMIHMSPFTGKKDPAKDQQISATWNVWIVGADGKNKRKAGRGDDPNWSPDGFVTRSFPDPSKGGANIMIARDAGWTELPILPPGTTRYGRFTWKPN